MPQQTDPLYLMGGGGHGRVVLDALLASHQHVTGILDPGLVVGTHIFGIPVLGNDEYLDHVPSGFKVCIGMGLNPGDKRRADLFDALVRRSAKPVSVIHPSAILSHFMTMDEGVQIMAGAVIQNGCDLQKNIIINTRASIDHDCQLRTHSFIGPGAVLCGGVEIGEGSFIGANATILPSIKIGKNVIIGAGTVVTKNVSDNQVIYNRQMNK